MQGKNATKIIAEPGKQELFIIREFEAPRISFLKHLQILIFCCNGLTPASLP